VPHVRILGRVAQVRNARFTANQGAPGPAFETWETTNPLRAKSERLAPPQVASVRPTAGGRRGLRIIKPHWRTIKMLPRERENPMPNLPEIAAQQHVETTAAYELWDRKNPGIIN